MRHFLEHWFFIKEHSLSVGGRKFPLMSEKDLARGLHCSHEEYEKIKRRSTLIFVIIQFILQEDMDPLQHYFITMPYQAMFSSIFIYSGE